ncbi:bifunctional fucokinase/fucose-1-phosphate guanylyltransferase [Prolixibacteraceae bacterium Z1-6]|uniref:Bifunctional fucokinase/fucose-1-phosphate guanylyltransferase n=1 Tax=Draconibacterium aestuarii TaxID=2998507 RepID=A0A9X3F270_9BACT|nr:bifunctional fucokinase/fucose-1-phosphate guanylyltransferase [Prolixibacteraceae bacterium Z1-6]
MKHLISVPNPVVPHFHKIAEVNPEDWFVASDPENTKVGSGGGTAHILSELFTSEKEADFESWLEEEKRVIIHAGGQSRRLPAYAPIGKSLIPMPVFRWSRGQHLNQRLVHLQSPLFDKIIENAPPKLKTLIASGDTLIFGGKQLPEIPEADIVCFGLWLEPEKACNHGVFFAKHETPQELQFMLQKPSIEKIQELIGKYYFLMDIGIWLLSSKAINILMKNCGWDKNGFKNGIPGFYDLYSEFGTALGTSPSSQNKEINELTVALVNLEGGEFHHLGNTSELVTSNLTIQNRINDQREIWHKHIKPHPSIFVLNSDIKNNFIPTNKNIWVENSVVSDSWNFKQNHVLTGIQKNNWSLDLEPGNCLDIIPVSSENVIIRNYGFYDNFRGARNNSATTFMGQSLSAWLEKRDLREVFNELDKEEDIFDLPLFCVLSKNNLDVEFIKWLLQETPKTNQNFTELWKSSKRVNCNEIATLCAINEVEKQRKNLRLKNYPALAANYRHSVFYQLDLKKTANDFFENKLELPPVISNEMNDLLPIHDHMFRSSYLRSTNKEWQNEETAAFSYLQKRIVDIYKNNRVEPRINLLPDQIAWGRSPVRLDLAGGWTDTPPYCFLYGGKVVNIAVELNGQPPLHCYIKGTTTNEIVLRSIDLGAREVLTTFEDIRSFENIQSAFSIPKAALALSGFLPEFAGKHYSSLRQQLESMGGGLELTILSAVPKGSGLGTSSILAATVLGTLAEVCCFKWDKQEIGKRTLALEQLLTTGGGWQDQFGGLHEGIKLFTTSAGKLQEPSVKWLPDSLFTKPEYKNRILLYYTGITRVAKSILGEIVRGMFLNSQEHLAILEDLKLHAANTYEALQQKDFMQLAKMTDRSWQLNQKIDAGTNTPEIQQLIDRIQPFILAQKLLGAGGGGFMLMLAKDENAAILLKSELVNSPVNKRGRFVDFEVSQTGFQVTKS